MPSQNGNVIQIQRVPSIHSRLPRRAEKGAIHVNTLYLLICIFLRLNIAPNGPSDGNEHPKAILDDVLIIEHNNWNVIQTAPSQSIPSHPHWGAEKGGLGVIKLGIPKYKISPPESAPIPPNYRNTVSKHPKCCFSRC
jgi:hypothetical protein